MIRYFGRIKPGTVVWQDFRASAWPDLPGARTHNPDQRFAFNKEGDGVIATAPGYGDHGGATGDYGNGALFIVAARALLRHSEGKE